MFTLPVTGTYSVTIDPRDQNTGRITFRLDPVPDNTGTTTIGTPTTVTIGTVGENAGADVRGDGGPEDHDDAVGEHIAAVDVTIRQPNGTFVGSQFLSGLGVFRDVMTLPVTGTYTVTIDPRDQNTGTLTFRLDPVPDNTGTTAIGVPTTVTTRMVGENAGADVRGDRGPEDHDDGVGQRHRGVDLTIRQPNGTFVGSLFVSGPSAFHDVMTLPVTGTYTITIDPRDQNTGQLTFTLNAVTGDRGAENSLDGLRGRSGRACARRRPLQPAAAAAADPPVLTLRSPRCSRTIARGPRTSPTRR